jgi:hypothetical protein
MRHAVSSLRAFVFAVLPVLALCWGAPARADSAGHDITFTVTRNGGDIGTQTIRFDKKGDTLNVALQTRIKVKVLFVTAYTFTYDGTETWKDGKLVALESHTDDNGDKVDVAVTKKDGKLVMTSGGATKTLSADIIPTTWWKRDLVNRKEMLDVLTGKVVKVSFARDGQEKISAGGKEIDAVHYTVSGDIDRDIWFAKDGSIVKQSLKKKGDTIQYVLK